MAATFPAAQSLVLLRSLSSRLPQPLEDCSGVPGKLLDQVWRTELAKAFLDLLAPRNPLESPELVSVPPRPRAVLELVENVQSDQHSLPELGIFRCIAGTARLTTC